MNDSTQADGLNSAVIRKLFELLDSSLTVALSHTPSGKAWITPQPMPAEELGLVELFEEYGGYSAEGEDDLGGPKEQLNQWFIDGPLDQRPVLLFDWSGDLGSLDLLRTPDKRSKRGYLVVGPYDQLGRDWTLFAAFEPFDNIELLGWLIIHLVSKEAVAELLYGGVPLTITLSDELPLNREALTSVVSAMASVRGYSIRNLEFIEDGYHLHGVDIDTTYDDVLSDSATGTPILKYIDRGSEDLILYEPSAAARAKKIVSLAESVSTWGELRELLRREPPDITGPLLEHLWAEWDEGVGADNLGLTDDLEEVPGTLEELLEALPDDEPLTIRTMNDDGEPILMDPFEPASMGVPRDLLRLYVEQTTPGQSWYLPNADDLEEIRAEAASLGYVFREGHSDDIPYF